MKLLTFLVIFGVVGLIVGYFIFGQWNGSYIPVQEFIFKPKNLLEQAGQTITGVAKIRQNILIAGAVGAGFGLILGAVGRRR